MFRAQELCAQATRAAAPLKIKDVKVIATSPARQRWVFIKVLTSEDGLYGLGIDLKEEIAARFPLLDDARVSDWTTVRGVDGSRVRP